VAAATEQISEAWLEPLLEALLEQFPFTIHGFHSDNGSEFINHTVAELLGSTRGQLTNQRVYNFRVADHPDGAGNFPERGIWTTALGEAAPGVIHARRLAGIVSVRALAGAT